MGAAAVHLPLSLLLKAIDVSDLTTLRSLLTHMCQSSDKLAATVSEYLLVQKGELLSSVSRDDTRSEVARHGEDRESSDWSDGDEDKEEDEAEDGDSDASSTDAGDSSDEDEDDIKERAPKRIKLSAEYAGKDAELISRYETCTTCDERFDILVNHSKACRIHDGELEIDYENDCLADDDEVAYAGIDPETDWRREQNPEAFIWTCCEGDGAARPCRASRHVAKREDPKIPQREYQFFLNSVEKRKRKDPHGSRLC